MTTTTNRIAPHLPDATVAAILLACSQAFDRMDADRERAEYLAGSVMAESSAETYMRSLARYGGALDVASFAFGCHVAEVAEALRTFHED